MRRVAETYAKLVWLNPVPEERWGFTQSIDITRRLVEDRMYPMTLKGMEEAMGYLSR